MGNLPQTWYEYLMGFRCMCFCLFCHGLGALMLGLLKLQTLFNSLRPSDAYMRWQTNHHWFRPWLVAWTAPSHDLNQRWNMVNETLTNKLQWDINRNSYIFIQENALENVVCEMASILSRPQCVKVFSIIYSIKLSVESHKYISFRSFKSCEK